MNADLIHIIFGMKVRQARLEKGLSLTEFANRCSLSASYLTEVEKGRKYPKPDKILKIAQVLGKAYDDLVSISLEPSLAYLESALASPLLQQFPFDEFGLEVADLLNLLTRAPDKASALLATMLEIGRVYDMKEEHILRAALRSYQELHDNYFPELEEAADAAIRQFGLTVPASLDALVKVLTRHYAYRLDETVLAQVPALSNYRSVVVRARQPRLLINPALHPAQIKFLAAREIGHSYLGLKGRAYTSPPEVVESFEQVFNDFRASYFAGALLMPSALITRDIQAFFGQARWRPDLLQAMLTRYDVTPEMLFYRFSELAPQFFGVGLHFLRSNGTHGVYRLVKQLNMNQLPLPSGLGLHEHYCRRWLTVRLLREMEEKEGDSAESPHYGAQMSEFLGSGERFFCLGIGRKLALSPGANSSVVIGFRVNDHLEEVIRFLDDPDIPFVIINETCERCSLSEAQCNLRAASPTIWQQQQAVEQRQAALRALLAELRA